MTEKIKRSGVDCTRRWYSCPGMDAAITESEFGVALLEVWYGNGEKCSWIYKNRKSALSAWYRIKKGGK